MAGEAQHQTTAHEPERNVKLPRSRKGRLTSDVLYGWSYHDWRAGRGTTRPQLTIRVPVVPTLLGVRLDTTDYATLWEAAPLLSGTDRATQIV